jgi:hemerythrin superfamily protein
MSLILNDPRPLLGDARDRFAGRAEAVRAALSEHKDVIARVADQAVRAAGRKGRPKLFGAAFLGFAAGVAVLGARKAAMQATTGLAGDWFAALEADHALADGLFRAIEQTAEDETAKRHLLFSKLVYALAKHQFEEEHVIYPALRQGGRAETPKHLAAEHFDMKHLMHSLSEMDRNDPRWMPTLRELHKLVAEHVREEEEIVFPALRARLSKAENAHLSRAMHREGLKLA